jgi:hypothetical protein
MSAAVAAKGRTDMNTKLISTTVLALALAVGTVAAQSHVPDMWPGYAELYFEGAVPIAATDYAVSCGTDCNLVAEFYLPADDFAIIVANYNPAQPLEWSTLCIAPMPACQSVCMGGVIPVEFQGCCLAFVAIGASSKGISFSDTMILHIN